MPSVLYKPSKSIIYRRPGFTYQHANDEKRRKTVAFDVKKRDETSAKLVVLCNICTRIDKSHRVKNLTRIPHGLIPSLVREQEEFFPWLDRNAVMN